MYVHHAAKLIYLATPRTASTATSVALHKVGFVKPTPGDHHMPLYSQGSPVTKETRAEWTVFSTVRNHWDLAVSWAAMKGEARSFSPPWPRELFELALDPEKNKHVLRHKLYDAHLPHCNTVLRYESLWEDLCRVLTTAGVQMPYLGHHNVSTLRDGHHYSYFLTDEVATYIAERYTHEIVELGFTFERIENPPGEVDGAWAEFAAEQSELRRNNREASARMVFERDRRLEESMVAASQRVDQAAKGAGIERCACCEIESPQHPMVGVTRDDDGTFIAVPVCMACWRFEGRRKHRIKAHFFDRRQAATAVATAGSSSLGGRR